MFIGMIISASRRTDIPAFYAAWFINRIRAGYCLTPNPFDARQVGRISLLPEDVEAIVFWTRNPRPLLPYLNELDQRGYRYCFQVTLLGYPRQIDARSPRPEAVIATLRELASRIGPERVIWRYDPLVFSEITSPDYHRRAYESLARALRGSTTRSVISLMDEYGKARKRLNQLASQGAALTWTKESSPLSNGELPSWLGGLIGDLAQIAAENGMEIVSCAETLNLQPYGVRPGKCIDNELLQRLFGLQVPAVKDPGQRKACGCVVSKDIGMYDSCLFGCSYCYATSSFQRARSNYLRHDPKGEALLLP
jgi:hypothetical protein